MPFHTYILASKTKVLYIGVTSDLCTRIDQHKRHVVRGFTQRYNVDRLVYFEEFSEAIAAITREKELKLLNRARKISLIERTNPDWKDLSDEF